MKYFVKNQFNNIVIANLKKEPSEKIAKYYTAVTEEQELFILAHPKATVMEIFNMQMNDTEETVTINNETNIDSATLLSDFKNDVTNYISDLSLTTSNKYIKDYKLLNAQASLSVNDGEGIYTHEEAQKVISEYISIGKTCRDKFYEIKELIENAETIEEVKTIQNNAVEYYSNL